MAAEAVPATTVRPRFLQACRGEPVDATPVWFMRQAGRYLPEYRELRGDRDVLSLTRDPQAAVEIALQPVRRMDVDAAILFSDIMVPLAATGVRVRIVANQGPTIDDAFEDESDIARLRQLHDDDIPYTIETIRMLLRELEVPLIGFSGAPFTLASYLIEGGPSRDHAKTKALLHGEPVVWGRLMEALTERIVIPYLRAQAAAGVHAVQLFDSWAGALDPDDYREHVLPWSTRIFEAIGSFGIPRIHFGTGTGELLRMMREAGADVVGVDWRVPLDVAWERVGHDVAIQGNLDPAALLGSWAAVEAKTLRVLERAGDRPGHVFNLGHGVMPATPPEHLAGVVDLVHERTTKR